MRAIVFAAGRGERLRPLTDGMPKALVEVRGKALVEWQLERLADAGITDVVVNTAWHADKLHERLGDRVTWSDEREALETAGAVVHARHLLGDAPFIAVNADVWTDYPFGRLALPAGRLAHLVLVPNPEHNPGGDFMLIEGVVQMPGTSRREGAAPTGAAPTGAALTFAGIGIYSPALFAGLAPGKRALGPLLKDAAARGVVSGEVYDGVWIDVGTMERLRQAEEVAR